MKTIIAWTVGAILFAGAVTPMAISVSRALSPQSTAAQSRALTSPGSNYFWENVPLGGGRGEWRQRPAGWQDPIYPPIGLSPSNQW